MPSKPRKTLVVGGTGMLAQATRHLSELGDNLTLVARRPDDLAHELEATAFAFDWSRHSAVHITQLPDDFDLLVLWLHDDAVWAARPFEDRLKPNGHVIRVHGSNSANPDTFAKREPAQRRDITRQSVILGWVEDAKERRWLTNEEISGGVIDALDDPSRKQTIVGTNAG